MAIGFEDEFDYLDDENLETSTPDAPSIKGAQKKSLMPGDEDDASEETGEEATDDAQAKEASQEAEKKAQEKEDDGKVYDSIIYVVKVTTNNEDKALEMVADKVNKKGVGIYSIARPHGLRGYILLESPDREHAEEAVYNLPYVKGLSLIHI